MAINWIRITMAVLVILAIGAVVFPVDTVTAMQGRSSGQYCTNYCQMHYREYGGLGQCLRYCNSHHQLAG